MQEASCPGNEGRSSHEATASSSSLPPEFAVFLFEKMRPPLLSPLPSQCREDDDALVALLLREGADANARNSAGSRPIDMLYDEVRRHFIRGLLCSLMETFRDYLVIISRFRSPCPQEERVPRRRAPPGLN